MTQLSEIRAKKARHKIPIMAKQKDYHKPGYWKDWYWNKGGRDKVQARRTSEEGRLKEKIQRIERSGLKVV